MTNDNRKTRLEIEAIVVGYAMSRLNDRYLSARNCKTWKRAFADAAHSLDVRPASLKNLRDEFDPLHNNRRRGWHQRPLRPSRQRVLAELCEVSNAALLALVDRILCRDEEAISEAIDNLERPSRVVYNVAERLHTGRLAEEFFLSRCFDITGVKREQILDCRELACGYDFGIRDQPAAAIEVKGIKESRGPILFTDREWTEALLRNEHYWLVVVGRLAYTPGFRLVQNPSKILEVRCQYQASVNAIWRSRISID